MSWRTRKDGRHYKKYRRGLYQPPRHKKYSEMLSGLTTEADAKRAADEILEEFDKAETRQHKVQAKRALVQRANRAEVASKNTNLSPEVRRREARIAEILNKTKEKMVLPAKKGKAPPISKSMKRKERAMVKDESEGEQKYRQLAEEARREGRLDDAKIYEQHARDEARHRREDAQIVAHPDSADTSKAKLRSEGVLAKRMNDGSIWVNPDLPPEAKKRVATYERTYWQLRDQGASDKEARLKANEAQDKGLNKTEIIQLNASMDSVSDPKHEQT